jgi:hypothetical protein
MSESRLQMVTDFCAVPGKAILKRRIKDFLKWELFALHNVFLRLGWFVFPVHYYAPVPNILELKRNRQVWAKKSKLPGIVIDADVQLETLSRTCRAFQGEYVGNPFYLQAVSMQAGPGYGYIEAQVLHGFIRHVKPRRIFEVGSGVSTWCMLSAAKLNEQEIGAAVSISCIDPNPSAYVKSLSDVALIRQEVQTVPHEIFEKLETGDLLFIDSSHTVKTGGDVNFLLLEVLPRLRRGVFVHIHDINLPYDYPRDVLSNFYHSQETSLVHAFLIDNPKVSIVFCLSLLHYERPAQLKDIFPEYDAEPDVNGMRIGRPFEHITQHFPSSLYLQME